MTRCARAVAVIALVSACDTQAPPSRGIPAPPGLVVEILNPDRSEALRCNPEIRLDHKVSVQDLESLSRGLLQQEAKDCSFGLATYYLPAMRPGSGAWALAELGPEVSVSILGLSADDEQKLLGRAAAEGEALGVWVDDTSYASVVSLYRDRGGLKLTRWYLDGDQDTEPIRVARGSQGFELRDAAGGRGQRHYRVGGEGELETWDGAGFLSAARKVRLDVDLAALESEQATSRARRSSAASAGRTLERAAAAEERWRKFDQWLTLYHDTLDPARNPVLYLAALQDANERDRACWLLKEVVDGVSPEVRAAPSDRIDVDPLLVSLDRLLGACTGKREISVLIEAAAVNDAWRRLDRNVEQVVSELRPVEE